jgi:hypothetical protein
MDSQQPVPCTPLPAAGMPVPPPACPKQVYDAVSIPRSLRRSSSATVSSATVSSAVLAGFASKSNHRIQSYPRPRSYPRRSRWTAYPRQPHRDTHKEPDCERPHGHPQRLHSHLQLADSGCCSARYTRPPHTSQMAPPRLRSRLRTAKPAPTPEAGAWQPGVALGLMHGASSNGLNGGWLSLLCLLLVASK